MKKRDFLKTAGVALTGGALARLLPGELSDSPNRNWAGNLQYGTDQVHHPGSVAEVQSLVRTCPTLKPLGTRHSFNSIADSTTHQVAMSKFQQVSLDREQHRVTVGAGVTYGQLAPFLYRNGYALPNLASLPHISVAGACATATHGSGSRNGNLATPVTAIRLVTATGEVLALSRDRDADRFRGAVVGLGALGVVTELTLQLEPAFDVRQVVYENLPFQELERHFDDIFASGYSVSLFTDWQHHRATQVWVKSRVEQGRSPSAPAAFYGASQATVKLHPLAGHSAENCTEQLGVAGPWYDRLPHFRMNFTPSSGNELQSEYFVPRNRGYEAILAVERLGAQITPHLLISELRTVEADELWMSPCHERASLTIHFTWKPEWPAVRRLLPLIETQLQPFAPRPHWGKLFALAPEQLQAHYPRIGDFGKLRAGLDPHGKFLNSFLSTNLLVRA